MKPHTVTLIRREGTPSSPRDGSTPLPRELMERTRGRVRLLALLLLVAFALDPFLTGVIWTISRLGGELLPLDFNGPLAFQGIELAAAAVSLILWLLAGRREVRPERLHAAGRAYMVFICFVIGISTYWGTYLDTGVLPDMTWIPAVVILFPLVLPGRPRQMVPTALLAGAMAPLSVALLEATGQVPATSSSYLSASMKSLIAVLFAYMGSRVVYGLGREVAAAREVGSYRLEKRLGEGGMGEVWQARHRMLARPAAIKVIRPSLIGGGHTSATDDLERRFAREARAIATLRSPHTVDVFDFGLTEDGAFYYAMELLDGIDADRLVRGHGPLPPARAVRVLEQICHSLSEAHARGLVHRDVKPANVFLCRYGEELDFVKVLDFGLVKSPMEPAEEATVLGHTADHVVQGTPAFMSPEQAMGRRAIDGRADLYAVGCVAYWLLTGHVLFEAETPLELLSHHARTPPDAPSARGVQVPAALDRIVLDCLAKDPDERPQSARELGARLAALELEGWDDSTADAWWRSHMPQYVPDDVPDARPRDAAGSGLPARRRT